MDQIKIQHFERGQIIPIVVVALIIIMGMSALILDGGMLMLNRRSAQAAADAGALAGARVFCNQSSQNNAAIENAVHQYTVVENNASAFTWQVTTENVGSSKGIVKGEVLVSVVMEETSFFARIFNQDTLTTQATAGAGCFNHEAKTILPLAYPCRAPVGGSVSGDCDYFPLEWSIIESVAANNNHDPKQISDVLFSTYPDKIYIVLDSDNVCGEDMNCNFTGDDDGRYQLNSSARGWLNLTGGSGSANNLRNWIEIGGISDQVKVHTWLSFVTGAKTGVFNAMDSRVNQIVWIPVFNWICNDYPAPGSECDIKAHEGFPLPAGKECVVNTGSPAYPVAHVVTFAPFFPTCVQVNQKAYYNGISYGNKCPGFELAQQNNPHSQPPSYSTIKNNTNALEGYFLIPDSLPGDSVGVGGADLGIYIVSLTR